MLQINEIMYDIKTGSDDGREWVEIYNDSTISVDLSSYRFFEADTSHKIKLYQGDENVPAKGYVLIVSNPVKFKTDWPSFSGTIFDSSFSLSNDGEVLAIKDEKLNIIDQYIYKSFLGGAGDGKSLQKIDGVWRGAMPTPLEENKITYLAPVVTKSSLAIEKVKVVPTKNLEQKVTTSPLAILEAPLLDQGGDGGGNSLPAYVAESAFLGFPLVSMILLLVCGAGAVYFIRKKRDIAKSGDDFEILLDE